MSSLSRPKARKGRWQQHLLEVIRSIQQLAVPLPALAGQADPIRSFQCVYNPLIARLSRHNLKLFPDAVIRGACSPAPSTVPLRRLPRRSFSSHSLTSFCGSWIAEFHGLDSLGFKGLARGKRTGVIIKRFAFHVYN